MLDEDAKDIAPIVLRNAAGEIVLQGAELLNASALGDVEADCRFWVEVGHRAYAKLGEKRPSLMVEAAGHAESNFHLYQPQSTCNLLWAYATLDTHPGAPLMATALERALATLSDFSPQNIANLAWCVLRLQPLPLGAGRGESGGCA